MHIINLLANLRQFPLHLFVKVGPCEIRRRLPQYPECIGNNPETAGKKIHVRNQVIYWKL